MKTLTIIAVLLGVASMQAQAQELALILEQRRSERKVVQAAKMRGASVHASAADSLVLVNLYNRTQGAGWTENTGWLTGAVRTWYGVTLDSGGRVTGLGLDGNGLAGTLPDSLGALDSLRALRMADNFLSGDIPPSVGSLSRLQTLSLWANRLSGSIPASLGRLERLRDLLLFDNALSGSIPDSLGKLATLDRLWLDFNDLDGPIPDSLGNLVLLTEFFVDANRLSGPLPAALSGMKRVISLYAGYNNLDGSVPSELRSLSLLQNLSLAGNDHTGPVPNAVAQIPNLVKLLLAGNQLSGSIPAELRMRTKLTTLDLARNQLTGAIPQEIGMIGQLRVLDLSHNQLSGPVPGSLGWATALTTLHLAGNQLSGGLPSSLGNLNRMESLDLAGNMLDGGIDPVYSMTRLRTMRLAGNNFSGALGTGFGFLPLVAEIDLSDNAFSGTLEDMFKRKVYATVVDVSGNMLEGRVPSSITQSAQLTDLRMARNSLEALPHLAALTRLDTLEVAHNRLTFEDLEPNAGVASGHFGYAPQDSVETELSHDGAELVFSVRAGGSQSQHQWYRDGTTIAGANTDTLRIPVSDPDADYHCVITNPLLPALTLTSRVRHSTDSPTTLEPPAWTGAFALHPNFPNPFSDGTVIVLELPRELHATVTVHDLLGRAVLRMIDRKLPPGRHELSVSGASLAPGTYVYRVTAGQFRAARTMVLIR